MAGRFANPPPPRARVGSGGPGRGYGAMADVLREKPQICASFGTMHSYFWATVVYGAVPPGRKPLETLDPTPWHSQGFTGGERFSKRQERLGSLGVPGPNEINVFFEETTPYLPVRLVSMLCPCFFQRQLDDPRSRGNIEEGRAHEAKVRRGKAGRNNRLRFSKLGANVPGK